MILPIQKEIPQKCIFCRIGIGLIGFDETDRLPHFFQDPILKFCRRFPCKCNHQYLLDGELFFKKKPDEQSLNGVRFACACIGLDHYAGLIERDGKYRLVFHSHGS